jgi:hypothetical protein
VSRLCSQHSKTGALPAPPLVTLTPSLLRLGLFKPCSMRLTGAGECADRALVDLMVPAS